MRRRARGSSPRVRGRLGALLTLAGGVGLIPAGAGQTNSGLRGLSVMRAHPRGCGADTLPSTDFTSRHGSSPRVRGRRRADAKITRVLRLIPAGAGQTRQHQRRCHRRPAHPRGCGADDGYGVLLDRVSGSSPRVRGRHHDRARPPGSRGLIPAGAGQTPSATLSSSSAQAHPRGCGADWGRWWPALCG